MRREVVVRGVGLHTGAAVTVCLRARPGPVSLRAGGVEARLDELTAVSTLRSTTVQARAGALRVGMVEHLFAALAGSGVRDGVLVEIDGPELPLLDGGASAWCDAIADLGVPSSPPGLRVACEAALDLGDSRYVFSPADGTTVEVRLVLPDARVTPTASWAGDAGDFRARIAPARTFALTRDVPELAQLGLSRSVDPASVVVLAPDAIYSAGRPFSPDEPARHKLLDLLGDLYLYGGPPAGRVLAIRPGHTANDRAFRLARERRVVVST